MHTMKSTIDKCYICNRSMIPSVYVWGRTSSSSHKYNLYQGACKLKIKICNFRFIYFVYFLLFIIYFYYFSTQALYLQYLIYKIRNVTCLIYIHPLVTIYIEPDRIFYHILQYYMCYKTSNDILLLFPKNQYQLLSISW